MREREAIAAFWSWVEVHHAQLERKDMAAATMEMFESKLFDVERFDWEITAPRGALHLLTFSPSDRRGLSKARRLVAQAPRLPDWEFLAGKPAKNWSLTFRLERGSGSIDVDGTAWEFITHELADGTCDVVLQPPPAQGLSEEEADYAAFMIVDGELGEAARLERVGNIETSSRWTVEEQGSARRLEPGLLARVTRGSAR